MENAIIITPIDANIDETSLFNGLASAKLFGSEAERLHRHPTRIFAASVDFLSLSPLDQFFKADTLSRLLKMRSWS